MKRIFSIILTAAFFLSFLTFAGCGGKQLQLSETELEMEKYEEYELTVSGAAKEEVVWHSSDESVVFVDNGKLTSLNLGSATITATVGEQSARCEVFVVPSTKGRMLSVSSSVQEIEVGKSTTVTAQLKENGKVLEYPIQWMSQDPEIATVENGTIQAVSRGKTYVVAHTIYKGQEFSREVQVTTIVMKNDSVNPVALGSGSLTDYTQDVTQIGFPEGTPVKEYVGGAEDQSLLFAEGVIGEDHKALYDRVMMDIRFDEILTDSFFVNLCGHKVYVTKDLVSSCYCTNFYTPEGKIARTLEKDKVYKLVLNLAELGKGQQVDGEMRYDCGIHFGEGVKVYIANVSACSNDYFAKNYQNLEAPREPLYEGLYMVYPETLRELAESSETIEGYDRVWLLEPNESRWDGRAMLAGVKNYREYEYFGFDFWFDFDLTAENNLAFFNGGDGVMLGYDGVINDNAADRADGDLLLTCDGQDVMGQPLVKNKIYTVKVKIKMINLQNEAFGFFMEGTSTNIFIAKPYLI